MVIRKYIFKKIYFLLFAEAAFLRYSGLLFLIGHFPLILVSSGCSTIILCDKNCFCCPFEDCISDEMDYEDYIEEKRIDKIIGSRFASR